MAPRTSLACILTGPSRSAPDSDFIFLDGTLNQVLDARAAPPRTRDEDTLYFYYYCTHVCGTSIFQRETGLCLRALWQRCAHTPTPHTYKAKPTVGNASRVNMKVGMH